MLNELKNTSRVVGIKQLRKALGKGQVCKTFLSRNADPALTEPLEALSLQQDVPVVWVSTMEELGAACGIAVGAAAAGRLRQTE